MSLPTHSPFLFTSDSSSGLFQGWVCLEHRISEFAPPLFWPRGCSCLLTILSRTFFWDIQMLVLCLSKFLGVISCDFFFFNDCGSMFCQAFWSMDSFLQSLWRDVWRWELSPKSSVRFRCEEGTLILESPGTAWSLWTSLVVWTLQHHPHAKIFLDSQRWN